MRSAIPTRRSTSRCPISEPARVFPTASWPDKAIDLIDEAGARVKLRQTSLPEEITEVQKRIKFIVHRMENAIANHELCLREGAFLFGRGTQGSARTCAPLRDKYHLDDSSAGIVTREDIEDVVSRWTGVPIFSIKEEETQKAPPRRGRASQARDLSGRRLSPHWLGQYGVPAPASNHPIGRLAHSFSSAQPASARPRWRAPWPTSSSAAKSRVDPLRYVGVHGESTPSRS